MIVRKNEALEAEEKYKSNVEKTAEYVEFFDILETITNVGNDEVFTPRKVVDRMLDSLPEEVCYQDRDIRKGDSDTPGRGIEG